MPNVLSHFYLSWGYVYILHASRWIDEFFLVFLAAVFYEEKIMVLRTRDYYKVWLCSQEVYVFSGMKWNVSFIPCRGGSEHKQTVSNFYS